MPKELQHTQVSLKTMKTAGHLCKALSIYCVPQMALAFTGMAFCNGRNEKIISSLYSFKVELNS